MTEDEKYDIIRKGDLIELTSCRLIYVIEVTVQKELALFLVTSNGCTNQAIIFLKPLNVPALCKIRTQDR